MDRDLILIIVIAVVCGIIFTLTLVVVAYAIRRSIHRKKNKRRLIYQHQQQLKQAGITEYTVPTVFATHPPASPRRPFMMAPKLESVMKRTCMYSCDPECLVILSYVYQYFFSELFPKIYFYFTIYRKWFQWHDEVIFFMMVNRKSEM